MFLLCVCQCLKWYLNQMPPRLQPLLAYADFHLDLIVCKAESQMIVILLTVCQLDHGKVDHLFAAVSLPFVIMRICSRIKLLTVYVKECFALMLVGFGHLFVGILSPVLVWISSFHYEIMGELLIRV